MLRRKKIHGDLRHLSKWMNRDHNRSDRQLQRTSIQMLCKRATFNRTLLFTGNQGQELRGGQDPGISERCITYKNEVVAFFGQIFPISTDVEFARSSRPSTKRHAQNSIFLGDI
jgi:hypothetical protein